LQAALSAFGILHYEIIDTSKSGITAAKFKDFLSPVKKMKQKNIWITKKKQVIKIKNHQRTKILMRK
jgi:hypothetical protein